MSLIFFHRTIVFTRVEPEGVPITRLTQVHVTRFRHDFRMFTLVCHRRRLIHLLGSEEKRIPLVSLFCYLLFVVSASQPSLLRTFLHTTVKAIYLNCFEVQKQCDPLLKEIVVGSFFTCMFWQFVDMDLCNNSPVDLRERFVPSEDAARQQEEGIQVAPKKLKFTAYSETVLFGVVFRKDLFVPIIVLEAIALLFLMPLLGTYYATVIKHNAWPPTEIVSLVVIQTVFFVLSFYLLRHLSTRPLIRAVGVSDSEVLDELREVWWKAEHRPSPYWLEVDELWAKYYRVKEIFKFFENSLSYKLMKKQLEKSEQGNDKSCNDKSSSSQSTNLLA